VGPAHKLFSVIYTTIPSRRPSVKDIIGSVKKFISFYFDRCPCIISLNILYVFYNLTTKGKNMNTFAEGFIKYGLDKGHIKETLGNAKKRFTIKELLANTEKLDQVLKICRTNTKVDWVNADMEVCEEFAAIVKIIEEKKI
jgi:hypothetical protein